MPESTGCIRGCIQRGRHRDDCDGHESCRHLTKHQRDTCTVGCKGCDPRRANEGRLCSPCHNRMRDWFSDGPNSVRSAIGHLTRALEGYVKAVDYDRDRVGNEGPPAPLKLEVYDCRQTLLDRVFVYEEAVREHYGREERSHAKVRSLLNVPSWDREPGSPRPSFDPVEGLRFLNAWLTKMEDDLPADLLVEMWDSLADAMILAHSIAPWRAEVRTVAGIPCPECERTQLVLYGGEDRVTCRWCGAMFTRDYFDRWVVMVEWMRANPASSTA